MKLSKKILMSKYRGSNISLSPKSPTSTLRRNALSCRSEGVSPSKWMNQWRESIRSLDIFLLEELIPLKRVYSPSFANDIFNEDLDSSFSTDFDRTRFKCFFGCNKAYQIHKMRKCWSSDSSNLSSKCGQYCLPCGEKVNYTSSEDVNEI